MAINIKNLQERIQKKIFSVSPSTPTADLGDIVEAATLATGSLRQYDSAGLLPSVTSTQAQIAYTKKDNAIKHKSANTTTWKTLTSDAYAAGPTGPSFAIQGSTYGWSLGGTTGSPPSTGWSNVIQKWSYASDGDGSDAGDLTGDYRKFGVGKSSTKGYLIGGHPESSSPSKRNNIESYAFASDGNAAVQPGTMLTAIYNAATEPMSPVAYDFIYIGGMQKVAPSTTDTAIERFPTADDTANSTDVGDLNQPKYNSCNHSDGSFGYVSGGTEPTSPVARGNSIDRFPFAATTDAADVGDLTQTKNGAGASSSTTHGYSAGGSAPPTNPVSNVIEKFGFAASNNATDVGDLLAQMFYGGGNSSTTHGYHFGGRSPSVPTSNTIEKYSHSSDANSTDVGNLYQQTRDKPGGLES